MPDLIRDMRAFFKSQDFAPDVIQGISLYMQLANTIGFQTGVRELASRVTKRQHPTAVQI